jgi:primosomal protein N' (replication factor Y)
VLVTTRSEHARRAEFTLQTIHKRLSGALPKGVLLGEPVESPLQKAAGQYRYQLMLRAPTGRRATRYLNTILEKLPPPQDVHVAIDVDPIYLS